MAGVLLAGLSKVYSGGVVACDQMDLEVRDGELLVLVGPSGSGKSTTLRLIAGLERATAGTIRIDGCLVNDVPARGRDAAMVFQSHALYPHWTAYQNIAFGLQLRARSGWLRQASRASPQTPAAPAREQIRERVLEAARVLGIERLLDRMPGELSGGEGQRVAIGRAMVRRPSLFLLDEPLSNLDAQQRAQIRRELKQLQRRLATTLIYVTHDQAEALALGDRVAVLNRGRIEQIGPPQQVYDEPANRFVAGFVGSPPMNFLEGRRVELGAGETSWRLSADGWSIDVGRRWWRGDGTEGRAVVGLRPENIHLRPPADAEPPQDVPQARATVDWVENQGNSAVISLVPAALGGQSENQASPNRPGAVLLCNGQVGEGLRPGDQVIAWFDMRRAHWFDGQSGRNLRPPGAR